MAELPSAPDVARRVADALEAAGLPYAIGGAIAYGLHAPPRATNDVDVNVFIGEDRLQEVFASLEVAGAHVDREAAQRSARVRGDFVARYEGMRIDVFILSIPLSESAAARVRDAVLLGSPIRVLAAEDLTLFKLLFFRGKDRVDVERLVRFQDDALDRDYVRTWLVDMVGENDERVKFWDSLMD